jgi:hypothetical protein
MHAFRPTQTVPREQPANDGAVRSQRFNCEHDAGVSKSGLAGLPGMAGGKRKFSGSLLILKGLEFCIKYDKD